jgi:hypothetical protein
MVSTGPSGSFDGDALIQESKAVIVSILNLNVEKFGGLKKRLGPESHTGSARRSPTKEEK